MTDRDSYAYKLELSDYLRERIMREAIDSLGLSIGSCGLDAGCGIGSHSMLLADTVGPHGHVTGLDMSSDFLSIAGKKAEEHDLLSRVDYKQGDITHLPFDNNSFDWLWSVDCAGYGILGTQHFINELIRVIRPGGIIALLAWSSQILLPGYPSLEAKLNATSSGLAPFGYNSKAELHFMRASEWFRKAGLHDIAARTFIDNVQAPLDKKTYEALVSLLDMRWSNVKSELSAEDFDLYNRICKPESSEFILKLPDYYGFFTYTVFSAKI